MTSDPRPDDADARKPEGRASGRDWGRVAAVILAAATVAAGATGVWLLRPKPVVDGRPLGEFQGLRLTAVPTREGETLEVHKGGERVASIAGVISRDGAERLAFTRVDVESQPMDVANGPEAEVLAFGWTGGAHCCITHFVFDGASGGLLGRIDQGNGDPSSFLLSPRPRAARAVMPLVDDAAAHVYGSFAGSPMPRIMVSWNGREFGLDAARMAAESPDGPPAYLSLDPPIVAHIAAEDFPGDFKPPEAAARGDVARAYAAHVEGLRAAMASSTPDVADPQTLLPMAEFLNEQVYKGHAKAGIAAVRDALAADPARAEAALAFYADALTKSRWLDDLDRLNAAPLATLLAPSPAQPALRPSPAPSGGPAGGAAPLAMPAAAARPR